MKKINIGYIFGIIGIILGITLNIIYPLNNDSFIFIGIYNNSIIINLFPNILLFSGTFCMIMSILLLNDKKEKD